MCVGNAGTKDFLSLYFHSYEFACMHEFGWTR